jgi:uncharacterized membrane protein YqhA
MKLIPGLLALFALSMFLNAIDGAWAFDRSITGTKWVVLDILLGLVFVFASYVIWRVTTIRQAMAEFEESEQQRSH